METLETLLWKVADAPVVAADDEHYAIVLTHDDFEAIKQAVGYDDQGQ